jgi:hypothetical protein
MRLEVFGDFLVAYVMIFVNVIKVVLNQLSKLAVEIRCAHRWTLVCESSDHCEERCPWFQPFFARCLFGGSGHFRAWALRHDC